MTIKAARGIPLVMHRTRQSLSRAEQPFGAIEESLPLVVERRGDGVIVSRDSSITEIYTETTDDT
jgi:hypothetical protein